MFRRIQQNQCLTLVFILSSLLTISVRTEAGAPRFLSVLESTIQFKVRNAEIMVRGDFTKVATELYFEKGHPERSSFSASIDIHSIHTGIRLRDKHLKSKRYFDAAQFPTIDIKLVEAKSLSANQYQGKFRVTIKGVEKEISVPFTYTETGEEVLFTSSFTLNRQDFRLGGRSWTMEDAIQVSVRFKALSLPAYGGR